MEDPSKRSLLRALRRLPGRLFPPSQAHGGLQVLTGREAAVVRALAQALFPEGDRALASIEDAQVVRYLDDLLAHAPRREQLLIRGLFAMFEVQLLALNGTQPKRFSKATLAEQQRNLRGWETSSLYHRRLVFQSMRALFFWAYIDNTVVESQLGIPPSPQVTPTHSAPWPALEPT
jgi:hypothetical protein